MVFDQTSLLGNLSLLTTPLSSSSTSPDFFLPSTQTSAGPKLYSIGYSHSARTLPLNTSMLPVDSGDQPWYSFFSLLPITNKKRVRKIRIPWLLSHSSHKHGRVLCVSRLIDRLILIALDAWVKSTKKERLPVNTHADICRMKALPVLWVSQNSIYHKE